mgnify:CR=1 FL=1
MYILWRADLWARLADVHDWWMHLMVLVWLFFALVLFVFMRDSYSSAGRAMVIAAAAADAVGVRAQDVAVVIERSGA